MIGSLLTSAQLDDVKTVVDIFGTLVTSGAVIVGGIWAYYNFVKKRTYRPRLEVHTFGQWREVDGLAMLHVRVTVKNIGESQVTLLQAGTGVRANVLARGRDAPIQNAAWQSVGVFPLLERHEWIEPEETVSDDLLLRLDSNEPVLTLLEVRLRWKWSGDDALIVWARSVIPVDAKLDGTETSPNPPAPEPDGTELSLMGRLHEFLEAGGTKRE